VLLWDSVDMPMRYCKSIIRTPSTAHRGFTIVELLMVCIIIAMIAGIGGAFYVSTYKRMLVEKAARDFVLGAKYARIKAIERQSPCIMQLNTQEHGFVLMVYASQEGTDGTSLVPLRDSYFRKPVQFPGEVKFERVQITTVGGSPSAQADDQTRIVFAPDGTAQSVVIQIGDGKNHYSASIGAATGKVKMQFGLAQTVQNETIDLDRQQADLTG